MPLWPGGARRQGSPLRDGAGDGGAGHDLNGRHSRSVDDGCGWCAGHPFPAGTDSRGRTGAQLGRGTGNGARRPTAPRGARDGPAPTRVRGARHRPARSPACGRLTRRLDSVDHRCRRGRLGRRLGGRGVVGVARDDASLFALEPLAPGSGPRQRRIAFAMSRSPSPSSTDANNGRPGGEEPRGSRTPAAPPLPRNSTRTLRFLEVMRLPGLVHSSVNRAPRLVPSPPGHLPVVLDDEVKPFAYSAREASSG